MTPILINHEVLLRRENARIQRQKENHDEKHYATESIKLGIGDEVWIKDIRRGIVKKKCKEPRSSVVNCNEGNYHRTRSQLVKLLPCESKEPRNDNHSGSEKKGKPLGEKKEAETTKEERLKPTIATQETTLCRGVRKLTDFYHSDPRSNKNFRKNKETCISESLFKEREVLCKSLRFAVV